MEPVRVCFTILLIKSAAQLLAADTIDNQGINSRLLYTPKKGWVNDPNGLVYADGIYHLFYQHNPYSNEDTNISWGHAISPDLVNWTDKDVAILFNKTAQILRFSGSAVVNSTNTSCPATGHRIVAIFTDADNKTGTQAQSIAYSDDGITFKLYAGNPVIPSPPSQYASEYQNFRDPKVFWYEPKETWVMVVVLSHIRKALFYWSPNLIQWTYKGEFSSEYTPHEQWECPDLFALPAGNGTTTKWVLLISTNPGGVAGGSGMHYHIGNFNGSHFVEENPNARIKWLNWGTDCYAGVTFDNVCGRRIMIFWVNNWNYAQIRGEVYKGAESFAVELSLRRVGDDYQVLQMPVSELDKYATNATTYSKAPAEAGIRVPIGGRQAYKILIHIRGPGNFQIKLVYGNGSSVQARIYNNFANKTVSVEKTNVDPAANGTKVTHSAPYDAATETRLMLCFDLHSITIIIQPGWPVFTELLVPVVRSRMLVVDGPSQADVSVTRYTLDYK